MMDDKTDNGKYAFLVLKHQYYKKLTQALKDFNDSVKDDIAKS